MYKCGRKVCSLHIKNIFMRKEGTVSCVFGILEITRNTVYTVSKNSQPNSTQICLVAS